MKDRSLTLVVLVVATAALAHTAWVYTRAEQWAMDALLKRERQLVA